MVFIKKSFITYKLYYTIYLYQYTYNTTQFTSSRNVIIVNNYKHLIIILFAKSKYNCCSGKLIFPCSTKWQNR